MDEDVLVDPAVAGLFKGAADRPQRWGWTGRSAVFGSKSTHAARPSTRTPRKGSSGKALTPRMSHRPYRRPRMITGSSCTSRGTRRAEDPALLAHVHEYRRAKEWATSEVTRGEELRILQSAQVLSNIS